MGKNLLRSVVLLVLSVGLMASSASASPLITVINTFGPSNSFDLNNRYLVEAGRQEIAVPFTISEPLTITQIAVAAMGTDIQVRIASNGPGNLPATPFFGGLGFDANGFFTFSPCVSCGTLPSAGTYWFIMTGAILFPDEIDWFDNALGLVGTVALDNFTDGWHTVSGSLPALAVYGTTPVPEPASLISFACAIILGLLVTQLTTRTRHG